MHSTDGVLCRHASDCASQTMLAIPPLTACYAWFWRLSVLVPMVHRLVNQSSGACSDMQRRTCSASHICSAGMQHVKIHDLESTKHKMMAR